MSNSITIKLKQHTPLIQFQGKQYGATLRASELKPKLDKFLLKHVFKDFKEYKEFLIGYKDTKKKEDFNGRFSFNYKVRISVSKVNKINMKRLPFYFGNIGGNDTNEFIMCEGIEVKLFSLKQELLQIIKENFERFLLMNNFGFRQGKGYGSFTLEDTNDCLEKLHKVYDDRKIFYIEYKKGLGWREVMSNAAIIYQLMKGGINWPKEPKSYHKSYLFKYMLENGIGNEKRFNKKNFLNETVKEQAQENNKLKYVRALLGVSESVKFEPNKNTDKRILKEKGRINIKYAFKESRKGEKIDRFQSPILFKIIDNFIIMIPMNMDAIFDKTFEFYVSSNKEDKYITKEIKTPSKDEFSLECFLLSFMNYFNNELECLQYSEGNVLETQLKKAKLGKIEVK